MQVELHDNPNNLKFQDFNLDKRDQIIEYGLFLDQTGLQRIQDLYREDQLTELNNGENQRLNSENTRLNHKLLSLQEEIDALRQEKISIKQNTQRETEELLHLSHLSKIQVKDDLIFELT